MADKKSPNLAKASVDTKLTTSRTNQLLHPENGKVKSPRVRKRKRHFDPTEKLPTPPPDPRETEKRRIERSSKPKSLEEEKENAGSLSFPTVFSGTEEAFQQLDKLHNLIEEILELREKSARLFRRVRELERLKALKRLEISTDRAFLRTLLEPIVPDEDVGFAESLLSAMLESSDGNQSPATTPNQEMTRARSFRAPMARQRSRSISTDTRPVVAANSAKRSSCHLQYVGKSGKRNSLAGSLGIAPPKVSKWTKVKAAFKWERATIGTGGSNSALGNVVLEALEQDAAKFLRLPEPPDTATTTTTPSGSSTRTAEHSGPPSPGTISSSSSTDDVYNGIHKRLHAPRATTRETEEDPTRRSRSLDGEPIIPRNIQYATQHSRDGISRRIEKGHKTPWGMVKDIIQSRKENVRRPLPRSSIRSEDGYSLSSLESSDMLLEVLASEPNVKPRVQVTTYKSSLASPSTKPTNEIVDLASRRLTPTLTITVPSNEELRSVSSPESVSPPVSHRRLDSNSTDERSPSEELDSASSAVGTRSKPDASVQLTLRERRRSGATPTIAVPPRLQRQDSKWNKVKRAFLTGASSVPPSPSRISSFFDETDGGGSYSASAEDLDNGGVSPTIQNDIQRNYQLLHDKLSVEFYRKLTEWEKLKNGQSVPRPATSPKDKDSANALLMGEEQLTPEFKKKLQEWKRIKKGNPSGATSPEHQHFRRRLTDWQIWRNPTKNEGKSTDGDSGKTHLSEDFLKKMEEWKKMKSGRSDEEQSSTGRRDSAEMIYHNRNTGQRWKMFDEKEFQPLDRVIAMIEREQQLIGKQKEKLLEDKSRLDEFNRMADLTPTKKEVLVHTSTGFYRFEGISQEFTKKLYEWEKSQGIAPESSTFRLLNPSYRLCSSEKNVESTREKHPRILKRSKSLSSLTLNSHRYQTPLRQPSSLSLNDITNLEHEAKSRIDSKQTIGEEEMSEELILDDSEPEAVIVDIEDVIEETASPMAKFQPQQTPVYCVTASETTSIAIPLGTVTASHEPSPVILIQAGETHPRVKKHCRFTQFSENSQSEDTVETCVESNQTLIQTDTATINEVCDDHRKRLYDPSDINICETIIEEDIPSSHIGGESDSETESSCFDKSTDNEAKDLLRDRESKKALGDGDKVSKERKCLKGDFKRSEGIFAGSDNKENKKITNRSETAELSVTTEGNNKVYDKDNHEAEKIGADYEHATIEKDAFNDIQRESKINDAVITVSSDIRQKKVLKTRRLTDTQVGYKWRQSSQTIEELSPEPEATDSLTVSTYPETPSVERIIINESTLNKIVVPTASNEQLANLPLINDSEASENSENLTGGEESFGKRLPSKSESKSMFVKTKRMIFSPFSRRNSKDKTCVTLLQKDEVEGSEPKKESNSSSPVASKVNNAPSSLVQKFSNIQRSRSSSECPVACEKRPPLPQSPILPRKEYRRSSPKETAPSIRMMIQRYNQKLQEDAGSPASSGSGSPIWRSPASERRVRTQMEKYQEEVRRAIAGSSRNSNEDDKKRLEKSASAGVIQPTFRCHKNMKNEILKSTSADFVRNPHLDSKDKSQSTSIEDEEQCKCETSESNSVASERRKNSLQNKNPEIFSNIRQSLVQEYKTLPIKHEITDETNKTRSVDSDFFDSEKTIVNLTYTSDQNVRDEASCVSGNISPDLIHKLNALSSAATQKYGWYSVNLENYENHVTASENSTPLRVRAQRIKKAKDDFFSRGPSCYSHDPTIESYRHSQNSNSSCELGNKLDFVKSASAGMINVDPRTFERLATRASESLPRAEKTPSEVAGTLSKIASKFRRAKLKRGKEKDGKMSTVSMLCRQSLLVDIQPDEMSKSCPTSPAPQRDDDEHSRFKQHRESN